VVLEDDVDDLSLWLLVELEAPGSVDCEEDEVDGVDEASGYVEGDVEDEVERGSVLDCDLLCVLEVCA
jgi:hypothetical protein